MTLLHQEKEGHPVVLEEVNSFLPSRFDLGPIATGERETPC